jgi:hypothetical protein
MHQLRPVSFIIITFIALQLAVLAEVPEEAGERVEGHVAAVLTAREGETVTHLVVSAHALQRLHPALAPQQFLEHHEQRLALLHTTSAFASECRACRVSCVVLSCR